MPGWFRRRISDPRQPYTLTWQLSQNGTVLSTQTTDSFVFARPQGTYTLTLTVTDAQGDTATASTTVTVVPAVASASRAHARIPAPRGNWIGTYGAQGYDIIGERHEPAQLRHRHALRRVDLHLDRQHDRPPRPSQSPTAPSAAAPPGTRQQLHGGCEPDRRPGARPGPVLGRLGPIRGGASRCSSSTPRPGAVLDTETVSSFAAGRTWSGPSAANVHDHGHEPGRAQRRPQRPVLRPAPRRRPPRSSTGRRRRGTGSGPTARRATTSSAARPACPPTPPSRPPGASTYTWPRARPTPAALAESRAASAASPPPGTLDQLHDGRGPDRRPDARPGALLRSTGTTRVGASRCRSATPRPGRCWTRRRSRRSPRATTCSGRSAANVVITVTMLAGPNAVLSGLFLDPGLVRSRPPRSSSRTTTTEGNWIGTYGAQGYDIMAARPACPPTPPSRPPARRPTPGRRARPTSAALQNPSGTGRSAAAWYSRPASRWTWT